MLHGLDQLYLNRPILNFPCSKASYMGEPQSHKNALHVDEVLVRESRHLAKRRDEGFRCPVCEKHFTLTNSYRQHLTHKGLSMTIPPVTPGKRQRFNVSSAILDSYRSLFTGHI
ncbi:hypothetical protein AB4K20DRAFT_1870967 [Rhizopus microsporus]